jgi:hypothetical protein
MLESSPNFVSCFVQPSPSRLLAESGAGTIRIQPRLGKVAKMVKATRQVLLCRVGESVTKGVKWVTRLEDYLAACSG